MHQCDYCIWYNREKCDCPSQMKARACKRALKDKESFEKRKNNLKTINKGLERFIEYSKIEM